MFTRRGPLALVGVAASIGLIAAAAPCVAAGPNPPASSSASSNARAGAAANAATKAAAVKAAAVRAYAARAGRSPDVPNPNPPLGGVGPGGQVVGGAALRQRGVVLPAGAPPLPAHLTAKAWMVTDLDTGGVLAARDPHGRYQPASVLKLLAGLVMIPHLAGDRVITASPAASNAEGSAVGLVAGGKYTVDTLFRSLFLMSGNDAAMALALANGGPARTVAQMNVKARSLGAYDTLAQTPSGLDGWSQLTSAYDLTLMLRAAVNTPRLLAYDEARTARLPAQKVGKRTWHGVPLFNESANFLDAVPGALLAKTGYTGAAQHTYVCAASRGGRRIGVVFLRNDREPLDQYQQAAALLNWAYALPSTVAAIGQLGATAPIPAPTTSRASAPEPTSAHPAAASGEQTSGVRGTAEAAAPGHDGAGAASGQHRLNRWQPSTAVWATLAVLTVLTLLLRAYARRHRYVRRYR